jgi:transcriptional regulator with XRE-family HTH domain
LIRLRFGVTILDMDSPDSQTKASEEEVRELLDFLRVLARALGFNDTSLARKANIPLTTYLRTLKGENDPKMSVVFAIVRALGLSPREFFELAYPGEEEASPARVQIERALGRLRGSQRAAKAPERTERLISVDEIERIFDRLRQEVLQGAGGVNKGEASAPTPAPSAEGGRR